VAWREVTSRSYGVPARYLIAEQDGHVRGVLPLFRKGGRSPQLFSAPGGMLADDDAVANALLEPAREEVRRDRLLWLELRDQKRAWPGLETNDEHVTMVLELAESPEAQWKAFDAKLRNQIRKGEKAGFTKRWGHAEAGTFHRVLLENMRDLGTPVYSSGLFAAILRHFPQQAELAVVANPSPRGNSAQLDSPDEDSCDDALPLLRRGLVRGRQLSTSRRPLPPVQQHFELGR
jgi:hypothetical protein